MGNQLIALLGISLWLPAHVVNFVPRPDEFLRGAVAFETPTHVKRLGLAGERHLIDAAVTAGTADSFRHVNAVIEIDVVGQIMDAIPLQWLVARETGANRLQGGCVDPNLRVTRHAGVGAWEPGVGGLLNRSVAVPAINSVIADVMFVAERDRLIEGDVYIGRVRRPINLGRHPSGAANQDDCADDDDSSMNIRFRRKQLGHLMMSIRFLTRNESRAIVVQDLPMALIVRRIRAISLCQVDMGPDRYLLAYGE